MANPPLVPGDSIGVGRSHGASTAVVALVRDLMFLGRIATAARAAGAEVKIVRDPNQLPTEPARRLVVDLNLDGAIPAASAWKQSHGGEVVGFVSHVDTATIERARAAGVDRVLARSAFVQILPALLE